MHKQLRVTTPPTASRTARCSLDDATALLGTFMSAISLLDPGRPVFGRAVLASNKKSKQQNNEGGFGLGGSNCHSGA